MERISNQVTKVNLDKFYDNISSKNNLKNLIMAVESRDGSFTWRNSPDGEVGADQPFFIASIDKLLNAVLVMKLHESQMLNIDDKISKHLPGELTSRIHVLNGVDYSKDITIRHLLSHTSGIADWLEDKPRRGISLFEKIIREGDCEFQMDDLVSIVRDTLRPHFPPQDFASSRLKARYSDTNFMLLISVIENTAGRSLHEVYRSYFPECLERTYFLGQQFEKNRLNPVILTINGKPLEISNFLRSDRAIYSTVGDLSSFMRKFIDCEFFADSDTMELMNNNLVRFDFPLDPAALRAPGWPIKIWVRHNAFSAPKDIYIW